MSGSNEHQCPLCNGYKSRQGNVCYDCRYKGDQLSQEEIEQISKAVDEAMPYALVFKEEEFTQVIVLRP